MTIIADHDPISPARLSELLHKAGYTQLEDDERETLRTLLPKPGQPVLIPLTELETLAVSESITAPADMCRRKVLNQLAHRIAHPDEVPPVLATLAAYVVERGSESERTMMLAEILHVRYGIAPADAVQAALYGGRTDDEWDQVTAAGDERDRLIEQARAAAQAAEYEPQPTVIAEQAVAA